MAPITTAKPAKTRPNKVEETSPAAVRGFELLPDWTRCLNRLIEQPPDRLSDAGR
jgi:hypothetical protein